MSTLIDINADLVAFQTLLDECGDELSPEAAAALDEWFAELSAKQTDKLDAYGAVIRQFELRAVARQAEIDRLAVRVRVDQNNAKRLKDRLLAFLDAQEVSKVETARYKFSACNNGGKLPVKLPEDVGTLPAEYRRVETRVIADQEKIRAALEEGREVPGCRLLPRGRHLRIS